MSIASRDLCHDIAARCQTAEHIVPAGVRHCGSLICVQLAIVVLIEKYLLTCKYRLAPILRPLSICIEKYLATNSPRRVNKSIAKIQRLCGLTASQIDLVPCRSRVPIDEKYLVLISTNRQAGIAIPDDLFGGSRESGD